MQVKKFTKKEYEVLKKAKGTDELRSFEEIKPVKWNNLKREYVAEIKGVCDKFDGLEREFISNVSNYSENGQEADLDCKEPEGNGELIEVRSGSHRNLIKAIFRHEKDKYRLIAMRNGASAYYGGGNTTKWNIFK